MYEKLMVNILLKLSSFAGSTVNAIVGCELLKTIFKTLRSNVKTGRS